jgi:predicted nucleic acid-binding protein
MIILDTDFLSAFLKINQVPLIRTFFQVSELAVSPAVYQEVAPTALFSMLHALSWIQVHSPALPIPVPLSSSAEWGRLGLGEREAIALAHETPSSILLINDNKARRVVVSLQALVYQRSTFLRFCSPVKQLGSSISKKCSN